MRCCLHASARRKNLDRVSRCTQGDRAIFPGHPEREAGLCFRILPFDPAGKIDYSKLDIASQTKRAIDNIALELKAANLTLNDVVSATVYVTDVDDFPAVNAVYASYFKPLYPARSFVQVAKLLRGVKVEITVIAAAK